MEVHLVCAVPVEMEDITGFTGIAASDGCDHPVVAESSYKNSKCS